MKRYEATGTITLRCYAENEADAKKEFRLLAREIGDQTGVHVSMGEHHQTREIVVRVI